MKYLSGEEVLLGDKVLADESKGVVVCVIDTKQFTDEYPEGWNYFEKGVSVEAKALDWFIILKQTKIWFCLNANLSALS